MVPTRWGAALLEWLCTPPRLGQRQKRVSPVGRLTLIGWGVTLSGKWRGSRRLVLHATGFVSD